MPHRRRTEKTGDSEGYSFEDVIRDIKALNSSVLLLSQKMNYLVRNEKILGRNFIILNKKHISTRYKTDAAATGWAEDRVLQHRQGGVALQRGWRS